jgi:hypothetical protein
VSLSCHGFAAPICAGVSILKHKGKHKNALKDIKLTQVVKVKVRLISGQHLPNTSDRQV